MSAEQVLQARREFAAYLAQARSVDELLHMVRVLRRNVERAPVARRPPVVTRGASREQRSRRSRPRAGSRGDPDPEPDPLTRREAAA
jgi:hypothetical protein